MSESIRVACLQLNSSNSVAQNLATIERHLNQAADLDLVLLPENFAQMPASRREQHIELDGMGPVQDKLAQLAQQHQLCIIGGSLAVREHEGDKPFARALVYNSTGKRLAHYDKVHLFDIDLPGEGGDGSGCKPQRYRESDTYAHGGLNAEQFQPIALTQRSAEGLAELDVKIGLTICYDLRFAEHYQRLAAQGAQIITVPSAFTYETGEAHWHTLLRARAIENQVYILAAAQTGEHASGRRTYGHSLMIDPWGRIIAEQNDGEGLLIADLNLTYLDKLNASFPVKLHRRLS